MRIPHLVATAAALVFALISPPAPAAPPQNDNFADAIVLPAGGITVVADNSEATTEPDEQFVESGSKSVWYRWTPNTTGYAGIRTSIFNGVNIDTIVGVFQGTSLVNLRAVVIDDDFERAGFYSYAVFPAVANSTYHIQVYGFGGVARPFLLQAQPPGPAAFTLFVNDFATISGITVAKDWQTLSNSSAVFYLRNTGAGPLVAHLTSDLATGIFSQNRIVAEPDSTTVTATLEIPTAFGLPLFRDGTLAARSPAGAGTERNLLFSLFNNYTVVPANDNFVDAYPIKGTNVVVNGSYENATAETGEPDISGQSTVWYSYTPPYDGTVVLTSGGGTAPDPVAHVYTGNSVDALTGIGADDDGGAGFNFMYRAALSAGTKYYFRIRESAGTGVTGRVRFRLNFARAIPLSPGTGQITAVSAGTRDDFPTWTTFGAPVGGLTSVTTGSRFAIDVQPAAPGTYRVLGWVSTSAVNMPSSAFGPYTSQFARAARAKFAVFATGQSDPANTNQIPNMRLRVAHRFAATAMLDLQHHSNADPAAETLGRDLAPSRDTERPSVYTVYLPYIGVPAVNNTNEPILRAFEAFSADPQDNGSLCMSESSIELIDLFATPSSVSSETDARGRLMKVYDAGAGDLATPTVYTAAINLATVQNDPNSPQPTVNAGAFGVTLDTTAVPADRVGVAAADFISGTVADTADRTRRVRVEPNSLYRIRFHATSTRPSSANGQIRFRARSSRFVFNHRLEVGPGNGGSSLNNAIAQQYLPGIGCLNPDRDFRVTNGGWYTVYFPTPLDPAIRPEFPGQALTTSMPNFATQPGPGDPALSRRDLAVGIDLIDSLGSGANAALDQGQVTLDRITIEQMTVPQ